MQILQKKKVRSIKINVYIQFQNDDTSKNGDSMNIPRKRKIKRPYSPETQAGNKKLSAKKKVRKRQKKFLQIPGGMLIVVIKNKYFRVNFDDKALAYM